MRIGAGKACIKGGIQALRAKKINRSYMALPCKDPCVAKKSTCSARNIFIVNDCFLWTWKLGGGGGDNLKFRPTCCMWDLGLKIGCAPIFCKIRNSTAMRLMQTKIRSWRKSTWNANKTTLLSTTASCEHWKLGNTALFHFSINKSALRERMHLKIRSCRKST